MDIPAGSTSVSLPIYARAASGLALTGKVAADFALWYARDNGTKVAVNAAGIAEVDGGEYRLTFPNAAFAAESKLVTIGGTVDGGVVLGYPVALTDVRAAMGMAAADMDTQLAEILVQATLAAASTGTGVHPCVWTVTDGTNTLQGAKVTFWLDGTLKGTGTTVEGGLVPMSLDPGVYDVAISRDGHVFAGTTHEVTAAEATWTETFEMTLESITPPTDETKSTVRIYYYDGITSFQVQQLTTPTGSVSRTFDGSIKTYTKVTAVYEDLELYQNANYRWRAGDDGEWIYFTPNASVYTVDSDVADEQ